MPQKKQRYCKRGHDKHVAGETSRGACVLCQKARDANWRAANTEKRKAYAAEYQARPEEKAKNAARMRAVRAADPIGFQTRSRAYKRRWSGIVGLPETEAPIGYPCQICKQACKNRPHADHSHKPPYQFRGWLCGPCNLFLGRLENTELVAAAYAYLAATGG